MLKSGLLVILLLLYNIKIKAREIKRINSTLGRHQMSNNFNNSHDKRILSIIATIGCQKQPKVLILGYEECK